MDIRVSKGTISEQACEFMDEDRNQSKSIDIHTSTYIEAKVNQKELVCLCTSNGEHAGILERYYTYKYPIRTNEYPIRTHERGQAGVPIKSEIPICL